MFYSMLYQLIKVLIFDLPPVSTDFESFPSMFITVHLYPVMSPTNVVLMMSTFT